MLPPRLFRYRPVNEYSLGELEHFKIWLASVDDFNDPLEFNFEIEPLEDTASNRDFVASSLAAELRQPTDLVRKQLDNHKWSEYSEGFARNRDNLIAKIKTKGVACLSSTPYISLMWAHYCEGHKGFVVEYDTSFLPFSMARPVVYTNDVPSFHPVELRDNMESCIEKIVTTKTEEWSYEKEFRLIHDPGNVRLLEPIDPMRS